MGGIVKKQRVNVKGKVGSIRSNGRSESDNRSVDMRGGLRSGGRRKEAPEDFGDREYEVTRRHRLEYMLAEPLTKFYDAFLVTRGDKNHPYHRSVVFQILTNYPRV